MTSLRFNKQVAIVVGGTSGVGRAVARALAAQGASVAILGRGERAGKAVEEEIRAGGGTTTFFQADAADEISLGTAVANAIDTFGPPDILYNNAGKVIVKPFTNTTLAEWNDLWRVNVVTMINSIKAVLPAMLSRKRGAIVNMASISSLTASPLESAYCTTKGACVQLTRSVAVEYRDRGIRCNAVCPGFIRTEHGLNELAAFAAHGEAMGEADIAGLQGRMVEPEEVAEAVLFLASDAACFVNGECLVVDNAALAKT